MTTFHYIVGFTFTALACALAILGLAALFLRPTPVWLIRTISIVSFTFIAVATIVVSMHLWSVIDALSSSNPYQRYSLQNRISGHYAWSYWMEIISSLAPELLWVRGFRRRPVFVLSIAFVSLLPLIYRLTVQFVTK